MEDMKEQWEAIVDRMEDPEREQREGGEVIFEEIMAKNLPELMKAMTP